MIGPRFALVLLLCVMGAPALALPDFAQVKAQHQASDGLLLDRHGIALHELRVNAKVRRLEWVALADISPALTRAVLHSEDRRFYRHHGVDWIALAGAAMSSLWGEHPRGASTITMQLAARLEQHLQPSGTRRSVGQKWKQIQTAREIEFSWTKEQILEAYLNLVDYRGELQGIAVVARGLFDKHPSGLDENEALLLAALLRAPGAASEKVAARACALRDPSKRTDCQELQVAAKAVLDRPYSVRQAVDLAPHVARLLVTSEQPHATSTLDAKLQRFVTEALRRQLAALVSEEVRDGAALVIDNASGEVLAYVGNSGNGYVDGVQAPRQAGSTLKPFLYGMAIESRLLTAASPLDDSPVNLITPTGLYVPSNYESDYKGLVSVRNSLASSLNIPAVRALILVGPDSFVTRLRRLGFDLPENGDYYGYSLALGSAEVSLWQLVNAYRSLANGGTFTSMRVVSKENPAPVRVMTRAASFVVSDILADRQARSLTFGLENVLATPFWAAVKTGTSKDMRDNWCIGFSDRFTVGVWVGNFDGSPMQNVSGVSGAAPVWLDTMRFLHQGRPGRAPAPPLGVVSTTIGFTPPIEQSRKEWFLVGTEAAEIKLYAAAIARRARVTYPANGSVLALDPDIPTDRQIVFFESTPNEPSFKWRLDGVILNGVERGWSPVPGKHSLTLLQADGEVKDEVKFEVRGTISAQRLSSRP